jgi:hypothetical protein
VRFKLPEAFAPTFLMIVATGRGIEASLEKRHTRARTDLGKGDRHHSFWTDPLSFDLGKGENQALRLDDLPEFSVFQVFGTIVSAELDAQSTAWMR